MQNFHNILFVSHGLGGESAALMQALSLARNNNAALSALILCPELPESLGGYRQLYINALKDRFRQSLDAARAGLSSEQGVPEVSVAVEPGNTQAERVVRNVLRGGYDLVVKDAESGSRGFKAVDMNLLRKCPCPVWLCRPIERPRTDIQVAVAVDPESEEPAGRELALRLLPLARSLADSCSGELHVISCWDFEIDAYLRQNFSVSISDKELDEATWQAQSGHNARLDQLIEDSGIGGKLETLRVIGRPDEMIPSLIEDRGFDILVMGTVARTGISGFVMGNTAENVLQKIHCSLIALKPSGFVSPVKVD
ncbi:universal stress protein [Microbulbifer sp.]|uniref:universal stress protein n=1 Tax=Microbulbifer sp. TaxID=1908541 RepID=UPI003F32177E